MDRFADRGIEIDIAAAFPGPAPTQTAALTSSTSAYTAWPGRLNSCKFPEPAPAPIRGWEANGRHRRPHPHAADGRRGRVGEVDFFVAADSAQFAKRHGTNSRATRVRTGRARRRAAPPPVGLLKTTLRAPERAVIAGAAGVSAATFCPKLVGDSRGRRPNWTRNDHCGHPRVRLPKRRTKRTKTRCATV